MEIEAEDRHPLVVLRLKGALAQESAWKLNRLTPSLLGQGKRCAIFDLAAVAFVDQAGIDALGQMRTDFLREQGQVAVVQSVNPQVRQTLDEAAAQRAMDLFPDMTSALRQLREREDLHAAPEMPAAHESRTCSVRLSRLEERMTRLEAVLAELHRRHSESH